MVSTRLSAKRWVHNHMNYVENYNLKWRHQHKDKIKVYTKVYLSKKQNRDKHKKACLSWNKRHPEAIRKAQKRYRQRKRLARAKNN